MILILFYSLILFAVYFSQLYSYYTIMNELLQFFAEITTEVRSAILIGGLTILLLIESKIPLFKMDYKN